MALSPTSSSQTISDLMELQPVILESLNAVNAVDGATIERRIRINRPDEGRGRCKGSRAWDPRKDFSRCICGRPPPCKDFFAWFDQIACAHMSGLYVRLHVSAGQDGFRNKSSKQTGGLIECHCTERSISCRGSTDHTICLSPCKFWHRPPSAQHGYNYFAPRIWLIFRLRLPRCLVQISRYRFLLKTLASRQCGLSCSQAPQQPTFSTCA